MRDVETPNPALCIDCDGTLIRSDLFHEALFGLIAQNPLRLFSMLAWLLQGKAFFKAKVADLSKLDYATLPFREEVLRQIHDARAAGRTVVLATAAAKKHAEEIASHLGTIDHVIATSDLNLSAGVKAAALVERFGSQGFDYIGDSLADLSVWAEARHAYIAKENFRIERRARNLGIEVAALSTTTGARWAVVKALRPHQWLKNLLVFVPALAGHRLLDPAVFATSIAAFFAFCACASSVYVVNDLVDLQADRRHHRKSKRPFASGELSVLAGLGLAPILFVLAVAIASLINWHFLLLLLGYFVATSLYSFRLKQQVIVDVILLAVLYTSRIIGGGAASGITPSFWLLALSMFVFLSLALVKRYSELLPFVGDEKQGLLLPGRGYRAADLPVLMAIGAASSMNAVLVLALYVQSETSRLMYPSRELILLVPAFVLYWSARLWMKAHRGEIDDDPVIFAARDWQTLVISVVVAIVFGLASSNILVLGE